MNASALACDKAGSGGGGIWQVTSATSDDHLMAGCASPDDPCCNARIAYAHAISG